jgi:4-carboxymuconolactone decarboxylase
MRDPKTRYERGLEVLSTLTGSEEGGRAMADFFESRGAIGSIALYTGAGEIWARTELSRRDRSMAVISALTALGRETELRVHIAGGLNHGLSVDEIDEIFVQVSAYVGVPFGLAAAGIAAEVFAERDGTERRKTPPAPLELKDPEKRRADGLELLKTLIGPADLDTAAMEQRILTNQGFMGDLVMDYAFGDVWMRPQLSRRDRSFVVISALTALNLKHELEIHIQGALNHGVTRVEIEEMLVTMILYAGFPKAIDGMILARKVFARADEAS